MISFTDFIESRIYNLRICSIWHCNRNQFFWYQISVSHSQYFWSQFYIQFVCKFINYLKFMLWLYYIKIRRCLKMFLFFSLSCSSPINSLVILPKAVLWAAYISIFFAALAAKLPCKLPFLGPSLFWVSALFFT